MDPGWQSLFERALTDYIKTSNSKLCVVNAKKLRRFMSQHPDIYPNLPEDTALGNMLSAFFRFRATIYDVEKIKSGLVSVSGLTPLWVDKKLNVVGLTE